MSIKESKQPFQIGDVNDANLQQLRVINVNTLPVRYSDKFYKELIDNYTNEYMKYAFWDGFVVAAVCARIENHNTQPELKKLYIMTINVLAPYRRRGVGEFSDHNSSTELLRVILEKAAKDDRIAEVYLHVQVNNSDAKDFYLKHGFEETGVIKDYYKRIEPADCFLLRKIMKEI